MDHVKMVSTRFIEKAREIPQVKRIKGRGLMLGLEFDFEVAALRKELIYEKHIFTGAASNKKLLRILPPLNISSVQMDYFLDSLIQVLESADKRVQHV
jgi:acetylornithine aminotransferase